MNIPPYAESVWGDQIIENADGTFSVKIPYDLNDEKIDGFPNKRIALEVAYALSEAHKAGGEAYAMSCDY